MRAISSTSFFIASTSGVFFLISASSSLKRVSTVRRSCETPASIAVRCSIARSTRVFISMKACAARRTSRAPRGRKFGTSRPLPKLSAASASLQDRLDLVAQEDDGDAEQHQRGADHPEQEDFRIRGVGRAAAREHPHHRVVELDADFDQRRLADRVDPVRPADLLAQFLRQRLIEQREERLRTRRRHVAEGQEIDHQAEPVLRDAADLLLVGILRIAAIDVDQRGDILHHAGRQPLGDDVPVPLHEHEGDHRLQDHHRQDDDEQRARVEALRHHAVEPAAEPPPAVAECGRARAWIRRIGGIASYQCQASPSRLERGADGADAGVDAGHVLATSR